jgi:hypothetical protein
VASSDSEVGEGVGTGSSERDRTSVGPFVAGVWHRWSDTLHAVIELSSTAPTGGLRSTQIIAEIERSSFEAVITGLSPGGSGVGRP